MKEELFVSGRMNHLVDPHLNIWHWQIPLYLFLGGMAAGILAIAALYFIRGREKDYRTAVRLDSISCTCITRFRVISTLY